MKLLSGEQTAAKATSRTMPRFWVLVKIEYAAGCCVGDSSGTDEVATDGAAFSASAVPFSIVDIE